MTKFVAFAVDMNGAALARYDLAATEKETAEQEARQYLDEQRPAREVWSHDHRRVARIVRHGNPVPVQPVTIFIQLSSKAAEGDPRQVDRKLSR
jgi:hypothetical protein